MANHPAPYAHPATRDKIRSISFMSVRGKVAVELSVIAILTTLFLILFPKRNPAGGTMARLA